jgi:hypothetical protein
MTFKRLPDGGREITHPSGLVVIETAKQRQAQRAELVSAAAEAQQRIKDFDAEEAKLNG